MSVCAHRGSLAFRTPPLLPRVPSHERGSRKVTIPNGFYKRLIAATYLIRHHPGSIFMDFPEQPPTAVGSVEVRKRSPYQTPKY